MVLNGAGYCAMNSTLILGLGNSLRGDDGAGPAVVAALSHRDLPSHIELLDGGTPGLETVLLVSHPLHLERARILFEGQGITVYTSPTSTDLSAIPWGHRGWLTAREAAGIAWLGLESLGLPDTWPTLLRR